MCAVVVVVSGQREAVLKRERETSRRKCLALVSRFMACCLKIQRSDVGQSNSLRKREYSFRDRNETFSTVLDTFVIRGARPRGVHWFTFNYVFLRPRFQDDCVSFWNVGVKRSRFLWLLFLLLLFFFFLTEMCLIVWIKFGKVCCRFLIKFLIFITNLTI